MLLIVLLCAAICSLVAALLWLRVRQSRLIAETVRARTNQLKGAYRQLEAQSALQLQLNRELDRARRAAEGASEAKSDFLATISHELRTPLNAILGFSDMLARETHGAIGDPRYVDYARDIQASGEHLLSLINNILDLAKMEAGKTLIGQAPVRLSSFAGQLYSLLRKEAEKKGLTLSVDVEPGVPEVILGDELRLRQIMINLIGNAIKFTDTGFIRVRFYNAWMSDRRAAICFEVADSGRGIPADQLDKLYERFRQISEVLTRPQGGVGLGLAICRELVELMGGSIAVDSTPGRGTVFRVTLPLEPVEPVAAETDMI